MITGSSRKCAGIVSKIYTVDARIPEGSLNPLFNIPAYFPVREYTTLCTFADDAAILARDRDKATHKL